MGIKRVHVTPAMVLRINRARRSARRPTIPAPRVEPDKREAMIDRVVQKEMDDNDAR